MENWKIIIISVILIIIVVGGIYVLKRKPSFLHFFSTCAKEGEQFSKVYKEYPEHCCNGLTEWMSGMDARISIGDKCYDSGILSGYPVGTCINCGNGVCEKPEDICNCPSDCTSHGSRYKTIEEFCRDSRSVRPHLVINCQENKSKLLICNLCDDW